MAQRHVLMMLAAAATSLFLEGQSDRTGAGSANATGSGPDWRRWTGRDASTRRMGAEKTPVVTQPLKELAIANAG